MMTQEAYIRMWIIWHPILLSPHMVVEGTYRGEAATMAHLLKWPAVKSCDFNYVRLAVCCQVHCLFATYCQVLTYDRNILLSSIVTYVFPGSRTAFN
jgi:hypothetical protein